MTGKGYGVWQSSFRSLLAFYGNELQVNNCIVLIAQIHYTTQLDANTTINVSGVARAAGLGTRFQLWPFVSK
jgi:hypothetical protein